MLIGAQIALLLFLIGSSAYFSSAETAITSLDEGRLRYLVNTHKKRKGRGLALLLEKPTDPITALLILNNLTNVAGSSLMTLLVVRFLPQGVPAYLIGLVATAVMTVSLLLFGEITPKNFAKKNAERFTLAVIGQVYLFTWILRPLIALFHFLAHKLVQLFGEDLSQEESPTVSDEQIETLLDAGEESGLLAVQDGEMIRRILDFDEMIAEQVMIPRTDVQAIEVRTSPSKARAIVAADGHSRFPVYDGIPDNIVGTLYAKDLLAQVDNQIETQRSTLHELLRPAYYTPTSKPINLLLREFQRERVHMAVVIDEFGGMAGIVTLEDILEEIVGEIEDEYDKPTALIKRISPDEALIDGNTSMHELNRTMKLELPEDEGITVSGLIIHRLEAMPRINDTITIGTASLTVEGATEREITSVRVKIYRATVEA